MATGGIVDHDETSDRYYLPPEHAAMFTTPTGLGPIAATNTAPMARVATGPNNGARLENIRWAGSAALGGAALIGVTVVGTDFLGTDLASARLVAPIGLEAAKNFDKAQNIDRLLRE